MSSDKISQVIYIFVYNTIKKDDLNVMESLINNQHFDINQKDNFGYSYLSIAMIDSHIEIIKILLTRDDLNINELNKRCDSYLDVAVFSNNIETVKLLLSRKDIIVSLENKKWIDSHL